MSHPLLFILLLLTASLMTSAFEWLTGSSKKEAVDKNIVITYQDQCAAFRAKCAKPNVKAVEEGDQEGTVESLTCPAGHFFVVPAKMLYRYNHEGKNVRIPHGKPMVSASCIASCDKYYRMVASGKCAASDTECGKLLEMNGVNTCRDATRRLIANGVAVKTGAKCDPAKGWTDTHEDATVILDFAMVTDMPIFEYYCHDNCASSRIDLSCGTREDCKMPKFKGGSLKCEADLNGPPLGLVFNGELYSTMECRGTGWFGKKSSAPNSETVIADFVNDPFATIEVFCKILCNTSTIDDICWPTSNKPDKCKKAEFNKDHTKLICPGNFFLQVDDIEYKELDCSVAGLGNSDKMLVDYSNEPFHKLRVKCLPYCHTSMVIDVCLGKCDAKPEYKDGKLNCSKTNYELLVEGVAYNDVTCSAQGWKSTNPAKILVDNTSKFDKIKAFCRKKIAPVQSSTPAPTTTTPPPPPPSTNCTVSVGSSEARKADEKEGGSSSMLIGGVVGGIVGLAAGVGIGMFICKKKKNRAGPASNNMSKTTKGKKKSKEELPDDAEVTVMMPGHQMSQMTTGNLTAAIVASNPPPSIPSSSMGEPK